MTRPSIVRADTIDLQDHDAPSAKDHRSHRGPGAHQTETLREVDREAQHEQQHSPRLSWTDPNDDPAVQQQRKETEDLVTGVQARMAQEDALAVAQNGGVSSSDEGEGDGDELDDDLMDRISSSPSIEDEDIDFEFVYALHTFVATVEGQANATKGDTMVLLDDSNSYWWLVRVVKDSSIGYLPAEHIETPTERLARLNKHRNVDLSATMLGDQNPKAKNSFKSIRKRWKSVTFAEPTYVDYQTHEGDYSSDDEDMEELFGQDVASEKTETKEEVTQQEDEVTDETAKVAPLQTRKDSKEDLRPAEKVEEEERRSSEEILDGRSEPRKMSNGTVRDSFFKDDKAETKKITLTPNLLRDPDTASRPSTDSVGSKDLKTRASLDKMDKELMSDKESKKKPQPAATTPPQKSKDKKPSAIRSFFSRKDKKRTSEDDDGESFGKRSMDIMESRDSEEPEDMANSPDKAPTRSPSKLQKQQPRTEPSPTRKNSNAASKKMPQTDLSAHFTEQRTNDVSNVPPASMKIVDPETQETKEVPSNQQQQRPAPKEEKGGLAKSLLPRSRSDSTSTKPQKTVKAKSRMELDASDSSEEEEALLETPSPAQAEQEKEKEEKALRPQLPGAFPDSYMTTASDSTITQASQQQHPQSQQQRPRERLSESPVEVSPVSPNATPGLVADEPSSEGGSPSPELKAEQGWDDAKLRAFFDDGEHAKDLLAVVFDTTDVEPVGGDHPIISGFREQNAKLAEITTQLDNMLGDWLARKQRSRGTL